MDYVPPTTRELAITHTRAIVRAAVLVAVTRQEQLAEEAEVRRQIEEQRTIPPTRLVIVDNSRVLGATAALEQAVDRLTEACVEAQVAAEARNS